MVHGHIATDSMEMVVHGMGTFMTMWFLVLPALVAILLIVLIVRMLRSRGSEGETADDIRMLQEMHHTMDRLEQRIESLEMLLQQDAGTQRSSERWRDIDRQGGR